MSSAATDSDPSGHHDWHSATYVQEWIAADVLRDEDRAPFLRNLVDRLPVDRDHPLKVLDIGGGYGIVTRAVLESLPQASVVLHDLSAAMLDEARERLSEYAGRVDFAQADLRSAGWDKSVGGPYDLVTSSWAIHNVRRASEIRQIYRDIAGLVADGGCFVNIDIVPPAGPRAGRAFGYPARDEASTESTEMTRLTEEPFDLLAQLTWLKSCGFTQVDCLRRTAREAILVGFK